MADISLNDLQVDLTKVRFGKIESPISWLLKSNEIVDVLDGALSWTRESSATYIDRYGVIRVAPIDTPRQEAEGWLIESEKTNELLYSSDISNAVWLKVGTGTQVAITTTAVPLPNLVAGAYLINSPTTTPTFISQEVLIAGVLNKNVTFFLDIKPNIADTFETVVALYGQGGTPTELTVNWNNLIPTVNVTQVSDMVVGSDFVKKLNNGWYRVGLTISPTVSAGEVIIVEVWPNGKTIADITQGVYVTNCDMKLEAGYSSHIPTLDVPVTRGADLVKFNTLNNMINNEISIMVEFSSNYLTDNQVVYSWDTVSGVAKFTMNKASVVISNGGSVVEDLLITPEKDYLFKVAVVRNKDYMDFYKDGRRHYTSPTFVDEPIDISGVFNLGSSKSVSAFSGHIKDLRIYDFTLSATEIKLLNNF